jgi:hypothetical protein
MNTSVRFKSSLLAAALALLAFPAVQAATMSKADYSAAKTRIADTYKADKAACDSMKANAKDICIEEAKAKDKSALADLTFSDTGKAADGTKARIVAADGAFAVAKERCDDRNGNDKDVCVKEAKAVHVKAVTEAKLVKEVRDARKDAAADVSDADYKVAAEKCDAMTSDAKSACVAAAKAKFGKS